MHHTFIHKQECYTQVSEALGTIYRDLTRSAKHPVGTFEFAPIKVMLLFVAVNVVATRLPQAISQCAADSAALRYLNFLSPTCLSTGGNAYLTLDNTDEPYLGGIRFTAMPPMKRFR